MTRRGGRTPLVPITATRAVIRIAVATRFRLPSPWWSGAPRGSTLPRVLESGINRGPTPQFLYLCRLHVES